MMRFLFVLINLILTLSISAQEHFSFLDVPINGNINTFTQKMIAKGFCNPTAKRLWKKSDTGKKDNNIKVLEGKWYNRTATMLIHFFGKYQTVYKVELIIEIPKSEMDNGETTKDVIDLSGSMYSDIWKKYTVIKTRSSVGYADEELEHFDIARSTSDSTKIGRITVGYSIDIEPKVVWQHFVDEKNFKKYIDTLPF